MDRLVICSALAIGISIFFYLFFQELYRRRIKRFSEDLLKSIQDSDNGGKHTLYAASDYSFMEAHEGFSSVIEYLQKHEMERQELLNIISSIAGNMEFEKILETLMQGILGITQSSCGAFYLFNQVSNKLQIKYSHGFNKNVFSEFDMTLGEGFFGADFVARKIRIFNDVPEDTLYVMRTFLGKIKPKSIMVIPITTQDMLTGAVVLASIYNYTERNLEMIELIKYYVGVAVGNGIAYEKTKRLTNELKFQNKLIQNLNEELETKVFERILFLNNIIDSIQDYAIYAMDRNGIILAWNKGAEKLLGYSSDEVMGKKVDTIYPEAEVKGGRVKDIIEKVLKDGKHTESGWRTKKDGGKCYLNVTVSGMYDQKGDIIGMTNVTYDTAAIRALEDDLDIEKEFNRRILGLSRGAVLLTDSKGVIQIANAKAESILGAGPVKNRDISEFFEEGRELKEFILGLSRGSKTWEGKIGMNPIKITAEALTGELDIRKIFISIEP